MKTGFVLSILLHAALLTWAVVKITTPREFKVTEVKTVSVDFTTIADLTRIKAGVKKPKKTPKASTKKPKPKAKPKAKVAPKPKKVKKVAVLPPKPKVLAKPKVKPKPKKAKPKPKPKKVAKKTPVKKKILPKKKKRVVKKRKKKSFDPDKISALLNRIPNAKPAAADNDLPPIKQAAVKKARPERGRVDGLDARMTMNEIDAFRAQVSRCWNPPVGGLGADRLVVKMRLKLKRDGMLDNPPQLMNLQSSPFFAAASDAALRAVWQCQPYDMPVKKYPVWRDMILNFDPREMFQ